MHAVLCCQEAYFRAGMPVQHPLWATHAKHHISCDWSDSNNQITVTFLAGWGGCEITQCTPGLHNWRCWHIRGEKLSRKMFKIFVELRPAVSWRIQCLHKRRQDSSATSLLS